MNLKCMSRNVLVRIYLDNKRKYQLTPEIEIQIERNYNFNLREDWPSIAEVIDGDNIPEGCECLIHHNASHATYKVQDLSREDYDVFSIPTDMLFAFRKKGEGWQAMPDFLITYRIFKEYKGNVIGIEPEQVKQRLYVVNGKYPNYEVEGKVVIVTKHSDYQIMFHEAGRPASLIRTRSRELIGIDNVLTEAVLNDEYLIGNDLKDLKNGCYQSR